MTRGRGVVPQGGMTAATAARTRRGRSSTSTIAADGTLVPWLAAKGSLAYRPEEPPARDYYFQYGWVLPDVFADGTAGRRPHFWFGAARREDAREIFAFWETARSRPPDQVLVQAGLVADDRVTAPIAVYRTMRALGGPALLLVQHGSYQLVDPADQPQVGNGFLLLYRGVQKERRFRTETLGSSDTGAQRTWRRYLGVQAHVLSDSVRSFKSVHDRARRCETAHIFDGTWMTDDIARGHGLDVGGPGPAASIWKAAHQSYSLSRHIAEWKFGPAYVVARTLVDNVRITTFFAGEQEVRVVDPWRLEIVETHGCCTWACRS